MITYLIAFGVIFLICLLFCICRLICRQNDGSEDDMVGVSTALQMPMMLSSNRSGTIKRQANDVE
jgi:hypothetical protein